MRLQGWGCVSLSCQCGHGSMWAGVCVAMGMCRSVRAGVGVGMA